VQASGASINFGGSVYAPSTPISLPAGMSFQFWNYQVTTWYLQALGTPPVSGDVTTVASGAATVGRLQGAVTLSGTPSAGQSLVATSSSAATWTSDAYAMAQYGFASNVTLSNSSANSLSWTSTAIATSGTAANQVTVSGGTFTLPAAGTYRVTMIASLSAAAIVFTHTLSWGVYQFPMTAVGTTLAGTKTTLSFVIKTTGTNQTLSSQWAATGAGTLFAQNSTGGYFNGINNTIITWEYLGA
jgi:hypothetical protein